MNLISLSIFLCFISFFWKDSFNSSKLCCISFLRTLNILLLSLISIIGSLLLIRGLFILWFITKSKKCKRCIFYFIIFKKIINFKIVYILSKQKKIIISRIFKKNSIVIQNYKFNKIKKEVIYQIQILKMILLILLFLKIYQKKQ